MENLTFQGPFCIYFWEKILIFPKHNQYFERKEAWPGLLRKSSTCLTVFIPDLVS